jgi:thiol:disulfide interchange protein DsbD
MTGIFWMRTAVALLGLAAVGAPALGEDRSADRVRLSLVSEKAAIVPGEVNWIGVQFDIADGWHLYWNGQNDAGSPMDVTTTLPEGLNAGDMLWPAPTRHISEGPLLDHIYEKRVVLLLPVTAPATLDPSKNVTIGVSSTWIVCKSSCEVGNAEASLTLPIAERGTAPAKGAGAAAIAAARERLPVKPPAGAVVTSWKGSTLEISSPKSSKLAFYPMQGSALPTNLVKGGATDKGPLKLEFEAPARVLGVVEVSPAPAESGAVRSMVYLVDAAPPVNRPTPGASDPNGSK